ncbi:Aspartyl-tRNA synthetase [Candidatus Nasuia deltocephalinicola]|nr:Aspartyl-tRNA synthetase [Candidatus Nasuia deltocephalinicola]
MLINNYCNNLSLFYLNKLVYIFGWINNIRNHGNTIFIDLRYKTGFIQLILKNFNKKRIKDFLKIESCVLVKGFLIRRDFKYFNIFYKNGNTELYCYNIFIINKFLNLNFNYNNYYLSEFLRLKNRYLDLRGFFKKNNIIFRYNFIKYIRNFFDKELFIDIETPFLTKNTPEGSRDFLIPSRIFNCNFFALPQSPQIFKQLLMISGFDRYYQVVKCFRDEDLRSNRQFEFTQIDCEISFFENFDIINIITNFILLTFIFFLNYKNIYFLYINYINCKIDFYTDKPDLRINIKYYNLFNLFKFKYFLKKKKINLFAFNLYNGLLLFGNNFKNFLNFIKKDIIINFYNFLYKKNIKYFFYIKNYFNYNFKDLIFIFFFNEKFLNLFFYYLYSITFSIFGICNNFLNYKFLPLWIFDFPLFEYNKKNKKYEYLHNPFSSPLNFDKLYLDFLPIKILSKSYDIIINGDEIGGGSVRNNQSFIQKRIFFILNYENWEINFDFFLKALNCGAPIHSGIALGVDRFIKIFLPINSIRDIIAFPKSQSGFCLLTNSPNYINNFNLNYLNIICKKNNAG